MTNSQAFLRLHNTVSNELYQLQSKTTLVPGSNRFWIPGEIVLATNTRVDFSPVAATPPNQFFRGQHGTNVIFAHGLQSAIRPEQGTNSGTDGLFDVEISNVFNLSPGFDVYYRMGGVAVAGTDYVALPGVTNFAAGSTLEILIDVTPLAVTSYEFDEPLTLTLIPTNNYLIRTNGASASIFIEDNFTNSPFQLVTASIFAPAGMAYHPLSNWVIVSSNSQPGSTGLNFACIDTNGAISNWTGIGNLVDEIKLAIVQGNAGGFSNGDMYFGTGTNGVIGKLSADGAVSNLDWLTLPGETNVLRGALHIDDTGVFSNDLIIVTGDVAGSSGGDVWRVTSGANATLLTNFSGLHLEGVTTIPNDTNKYGPWAGRILTGTSHQPNPGLFAVDTNTNTVTFNLGIASEDIHVIPANQDFYMGDRENSVVLKLPRDLFTNFVGDVMITQEGVFGVNPFVFIVYWDTNSASFLQRRIPAPGSSGFNFEQGTFAPMNIPATTIPK